MTPFSMGGFKQNPVLAEPPDAPAAEWRSERDPTAEAGIDIKYSPTSNLALDLTLNTDFAQVEADDQQINLTRFALFFPEKRQFFQGARLDLRLQHGRHVQPPLPQPPDRARPGRNRAHLWGGARRLDAGPAPISAS